MKPGPVNLQKRQALRREEIIEAASVLFFEKGYGRTSMDDVIVAVGGSKRTLYAHFRKKEDLFAAVVMNVATRALNNFDVELEGGFAQGLSVLGEKYLEVILLPETIALYRALVSEAPFFDELARTFFENGPQRIANRLVKFFKAHNAEGKILIREPEIVARQFIGMIRADNHLAAILTGKRCSRQHSKKIVDNAIHTLMSGAITKAPTVVGMEENR